MFMYANSGRNKLIQWKSKKLTAFILEKRILCQDNSRELAVATKIFFIKNGIHFVEIKC